MSKLSELIEIINKSTDQFKVGDVKQLVSPTDILHSGTINVYVRKLSLCFYIKPLGSGWYIKLRDIPTDITLSELYKDSKGSDVVRSRRSKIKELKKDAENKLE